MLPVFGRPCEGPTRHAVIGTRGIATVSMIRILRQLLHKTDVRLLRDPDAMKQDCQLAGDGDDSTITGLLASTRGQVQAPLSQGRVFSDYLA